MTTSTQQREQAERFHALHRPGTILVLANAWDAASARSFERAGFPAIGTSSAALAWSLGRRDGEQLDRAELVGAVARLCRAVAVPVTVDVERGFGATVEAVCATVAALADAGAVGINIEDGMAEPEVLAERVGALRAAAARRGVPLFVNARTDVFLRGSGDVATLFADAVRRLQAYADAGADGLFAPGLTDLDEIARLVRAVPRPLNVYAGPGVPSVPELAAAGVRRLSVGCGPMQAVLGLTRRIAEELLTTGTYAAMTEGALSYGEANGLFPQT
jgi:2-methylisocitrate lyase-like PEP mutase family enzyme